MQNVSNGSQVSRLIVVFTAIMVVIVGISTLLGLTVGNVSYEEPVPIVEQVIDSYYGTVEDTIIYENDGDEDGYLYTLPQNDCEQAIFDKSYDIIPTNQKQSNLYDKATQEEVLYDLGNNNYTYNDFC